MNTTKTKLIAISNQDAEFPFNIRNNYEFSYKNKNIKVEIIEEADGFTILSANGFRYPVEIISTQQNRYEVVVNGVYYSFSVETPFSLKRKKILSAIRPVSKSELIKAPMPGKILDIMIKEGQIVNCGETLFTLEAMKMQNTIVSHIKGEISKINITSGASVNKDDLLVKIERL